MWDDTVLGDELRVTGEIVRQLGMRLTTHPGQFCVLSSDEERVVANTLRELDVHGWIFDAMGLPHTPHHAINIHGGKRGRIEALKRGVDRLSDSVRTRHTFENDETCYSVTDLLDVHVSTGVPICFDSHHHTFNDGTLTMNEASCLTWPSGMRPLQHVSSTEPTASTGSFAERRKHSAMAHDFPEVQARGVRAGLVDVECEFKLKNLALFDLSRRFDIPVST